MKIHFYLPVLIVCFYTSCAQLHHVQIGEIDNRKISKNIEIIATESGINVKEISNMLGQLSKSNKFKDQLGNFAFLIQLTQMGPKTGFVVFDDSFGDLVLNAMIEKCPHGKVTNITSIREINRYPGFSGEIVRVLAKCSNR